MQDFHQRLKAFIRDSGYDYKSLSLEIGQGERYISNLLATKSDPGFSSVVRICSALGITPSQIAGLTDQIGIAGAEIDKRIVTAQAERILTAVTREAHRKLNQRGARPLLDDVLTWWHQQGGKLRNFDALSDHVDLYKPPDDRACLPKPYRIGAQSHAAQNFGIRTADHLRHLFTTFDKSLSDGLRRAHVEAARGDPHLSIQQADVTLPGHALPLRFTYKRLLLPVQDNDGSTYVLDYSQTVE